jgi:hypothetical protein
MTNETYWCARVPPNSTTLLDFFRALGILNRGQLVAMIVPGRDGTYRNLLALMVAVYMLAEYRQLSNVPMSDG